MAASELDLVILGSVNTDYLFYLGEFPQPGETLLSRYMLTSPGGKGGNQAVAAARMGAKVAVLSCVGGDERGRDLVTYLSNHGVETSKIVSLAEHPTGLASIFVRDGGENLIVVAQGANGQISPAQARDVPAARYFLAQLEVPLAAIREFLTQGRRGSAQCVLNAAPAQPAARSLFPLCDLIIMNEPELATYAECAVDGQNSEATGRIAAKLLTRDDQTIIVTRGSRGAIAVRRGAKLVIGAHEAEAVDTTGAGDCFCGALVASLSTGVPLGAAIATANAAASLAIRQSGATAGLPTLGEVEALLKDAVGVSPYFNREPR